MKHPQFFTNFQPFSYLLLTSLGYTDASWYKEPCYIAFLQAEWHKF